jgi:hypothetical protein
MKNSCLNGFFMCALLLAWGADALAVTCTSNAGARNWNTAASWSCGHVPATGDSAVVPNGSTVTLDVNTNALASLQINSGGTLGIAAGTGFDIYLGGNLINNGTINFFTSTSTNAIYLAGAGVTSTFSGSGIWELDRIDLNGNVIACTGTCKVELSGSPNLQFFNATSFSALSGTNTFNALGNSTATVTLALAGNQTIATTGATYPNLVLAGSNTKTPSAGTLNIIGNLTVSAGTTYAGNTNNPAVILAGNFTNSGTFTSGTGTVTFNGAAAQTLGGTAAITFNNLTINKASNDVSIACVSPSPTVNATLALTSGKVITSGTSPGCATTCSTQVPIIVAAAGTITGGSSTSYVQGALRKLFSAGAALNYRAAGLDEFPVGDASNYTPVEIAAGTTSTAGSVTACVTPTDHPQVTTPVATTGIDAAKSVNRYWSLTTSTINTSAALVNAIFKFVAGDVDAGAATGSFVVEDWNGAIWSPTTLVAAGATSTQASNIDLTSAASDIAIGDSLSGFNGVPGAFNTFEASTTANAILGRIYTKIVGTAITLQVVAANAGRTGVNAAYNTNPITVALLDARDNTGAITAATDCRSTWATVISTQSLSPVWTNGRSATITITAPVNAWRDVRVRVTQGGNIGCSTDRFSIRPTAFTSVTSVGVGIAATNSSTSGTPSFKTGQSFNLTAATGLTGYDNGSGATLANPQIIPLIDNTIGMVAGTPAAGTIGGSFGAASSGTATGAAFFYSEVGNFGLSANAVYDNVFTAVDQPWDCTADFSNVLSGGQYGCKFGSAAIALASGFGRFIPDNFAVSYNTPQFTTECAAGTFTYVGQTFIYGTAPVMTVTARNGTTNGLTNATTTNYAGSYMKFTNATLTPNTMAARYSRFDALGGGTTPGLDTGNVPGAPGVASDPVIGTFTAGVGTLTFASGTGLKFTRSTTTPSAPFNADIALALNVIDADAVAFAGNPASFGAATAGNGIAFSSGKAMRFGRLFVPNTYGTEKMDLIIPVEVQYWGGSVWQRNTNDSCTSIAAANLALGNYSALGTPLTAANLPQGNATVFTAIANGLGQIKLAKPSGAATGSVDLAIKVIGTISAAPTVCGGWTSSNPNPNGAGLEHLEVQGTCSANYDKDPVSHITFGVSRNKFIFNRENY